MDRIDLQTHSTASDGTFSPSELLAEARRVHLTTIAITDHDTIAGLAEGTRAARTCEIEFVPGVEITSLFETRRIEILGYYIEPQNESLQQLLATMAKSRAERTPRILERLAQLDMPITEEDLDLGPTENLSAIGRPRIARAMVAQGYVKDMQEAFDGYLGEGQPANAPMFLPDVKETIITIKTAGGIAVVPHPMGFWNNDLETLTKAIKRLKKRGLEGIEVYYAYAVRYRGSRTIPPEYIEGGMSFLEELAKTEDMAITGGTDFHGDVGGLGEITIPDGTMDRFRNYAEATLGRKL
ncbi:MAG: PHP domain-containing protein [Candidatus Heimdallarchaeota archaeon]